MLNVGYSHSVVVVFVEGHAVDDAERRVAMFRATLPFELVNCVQGPFRAPVNGGASWVFLPDGATRYGSWAREGGITFDADRYRHAFAALFEELRFDDGSIPAAVLGVHFGVDPYTGETTAPLAWQS